jgi:hypothetical protein
MLIIILRRNRIARGLRVTRELEVFFGDVRGGAPNFDIRTVRLEDPSHRILTLAVAAPHALVLTVSHDSSAATLRYDGLTAALLLTLRLTKLFQH